MYILCIHLYIHVYTAGGECYVLGNGQLKAFMNISRVQGRSRRCLTRVNPHHHHQSPWSQGGKRGWGFLLEKLQTQLSAAQINALKRRRNNCALGAQNPTVQGPTIWQKTNADRCKFSILKLISFLGDSKMQLMTMFFLRQLATS